MQLPEEQYAKTQWVNGTHLTAGKGGDASGHALTKQGTNNLCFGATNSDGSRCVQAVHLILSKELPLTIGSIGRGEGGNDTDCRSDP
jgi:hypothetical protein